MGEETNIFRPDYRELSEKEKEALEKIKEKAFELYQLFPKTEGRGANREISLGMTALEESIMWIVKGITK